MTEATRPDVRVGTRYRTSCGRYRVRIIHDAGPKLVYAMLGVFEADTPAPMVGVSKSWCRDGSYFADGSASEFDLVAELPDADPLRVELEAISAAIGTTRFMDPPDGGEPTLAEQVRRMRERVKELENGFRRVMALPGAIGLTITTEAESILAHAIDAAHAEARAALETCPAAAPAPYLIWSNEHRAWWRPNRAGYTTHLDAAGRYGRDEAIAIARGARNGWTDRGRVPDEIAVCEADVLAAARDATNKPHQNIGHGHVFPRPDGSLAKCGGPLICRECAADLARKNAAKAD